MFMLGHARAYGISAVQYTLYMGTQRLGHRLLGVARIIIKDLGSIDNTLAASSLADDAAQDW